MEAEEKKISTPYTADLKNKKSSNTLLIIINNFFIVSNVFD